jgi:hypothetical protein
MGKCNLSKQLWHLLCQICTHVQLLCSWARTTNEPAHGVHDCHSANADNGSGLQGHVAPAPTAGEFVTFKLSTILCTLPLWPLSSKPRLLAHTLHTACCVHPFACSCTAIDTCPTCLHVGESQNSFVGHNKFTCSLLATIHNILAVPMCMVLRPSHKHDVVPLFTCNVSNRTSMSKMCLPVVMFPGSYCTLSFNVSPKCSVAASASPNFVHAPWSHPGIQPWPTHLHQRIQMSSIQYASYTHHAFWTFLVCVQTCFVACMR